MFQTPDIDSSTQESRISTTFIDNVVLPISHKPRIKRTKPVNFNQELLYNYAYFLNNNIDLSKYKIPELKIIAKNNVLRISGNKTVLILRISDYFQKSVFATNIQRIFRGHLVKTSFKLRGQGFHNRKLCVNTTDFYTMDPLDEIVFNDFFSYTDDKGFIYGFSITSLIELHRKKGRLTNPYNREKFGTILTQSIMKLIRIDDIIYSWPITIHNTDSTTPIPEHNTTNIDISENNVNNIVTIMNNVNQTMLQTENMTNTVNTVIPDNRNRIDNNNVDQDIRNKLIIIRERPINTRIEEVFMEMDQLGNYTESIWFNQLQLNGYIRFYMGLLDLWGFRAQLSLVTKSNICPLGDPFRGLLPSRMLYSNITIDIIKDACINVIESFIYSGTDIEYRRLGAFHVLTALTMVSMGARHSMPWLYDSLL
jgi:hypothetical protein